MDRFRAEWSTKTCHHRSLASLTPTLTPTHRSPVPPADRIIDSHDNEYVLSKPNIEGSLGLTLDPQLIRDMSLLIITSALAGQLMSALGQPTINGE